MQITYTLSQRDFFEAIIAIRNRKKWAKWFFRASLPFLVCLIAFAVLRVPRPQLAPTLAPLLVLVLLWTFLLWVSPWRFARTQFLKQPSARGQQTASFDVEGAKWQWDGGLSVNDWRTYIRWMESENQILLCSSPIQCNIVPKRALNAEQLSELRTLLAKTIGAGLRV